MKKRVLTGINTTGTLHIGNYVGATGSAEFTIAKAAVALTWSGADTRTYDGKASNVTASVTNKIGNDDVTVTVTGGGLAAPVTAEERVGVVSSPRLSITKGLNPTVVAENGRITYTFTIQNTGNTPVTATDDVILRDTFDPVLNGLTVTYNGAPWTAGTQYTYDGTTGLFATTAGQITVPAATYTQDPVTGAWTVTPGVSELIVTGTV